MTRDILTFPAFGGKECTGPSVKDEAIKEIERKMHFDDDNLLIEL